VSKTESKRTAQRLLSELADAMNALGSAGYPVRLKHGAVYTDLGYVLPTEVGWVTRTLNYDPLNPPPH
jgi:hypothetical protein